MEELDANQARQTDVVNKTATDVYKLVNVTRGLNIEHRMDLGLKIYVQYVRRSLMAMDEGPRKREKDNDCHVHSTYTIFGFVEEGYHSMIYTLLKHGDCITNTRTKDNSNFIPLIVIVRTYRDLSVLYVKCHYLGSENRTFNLK
jgi:hypothetical protein